MVFLDGKSWQTKRNFNVVLKNFIDKQLKHFIRFSIETCFTFVEELLIQLVSSAVWTCNGNFLIGWERWRDLTV